MSAAKKASETAIYEISDFSGIPVPTLVQLIINAHDDPVTQRRALAELTRLAPQRRGPQFTSALRHMMRQPQMYEQDVMFSIIELLATDPNPDATRAMVEALPHIAAAHKKRTGRLTWELRQYFYQALATRQRQTDREVWKEVLPELEPETLVSLLTDPAGEAVREFLEPMKLIEELPDGQRKQALKGLLLEGSVGQSLGALRRLMKG